MNCRLWTALLALCLSGALGVCAGQPASAQDEAPEVGKIDFTIDASEVPELKEWAESLRPIVAEWYPKIVEYLPSDGFSAPKQLSIVVRDVKGIAFASGTRITCTKEWFTRHPDDRGAVVHELVHVVQQYRGRRNPGWLIEGIADYIRWIKYEPASKRPRPNPARAKYTDSYQTTAAFLEYVAANHEHEIVVRLNHAMRQGRYRPELWQEYTGKSIDELWELYVKTLL